MFRPGWVAMPRSFDVSTEAPASVEAVHSAFGHEQYWLARLAAFGGGLHDVGLVDRRTLMVRWPWPPPRIYAMTCCRASSPRSFR